MNRETINDGIEWAGKNRGFFAVVTGFVSVVGAIVVTCGTVIFWANGIVNKFDKRITLNEKRLEYAEAGFSELRLMARSNNDELMRRAAPIAQISTMYDTLKRIEKEVVD